MARQNGRDIKIFQGDSSTGTLLAVVNSKTININNNMVDVTGDSDNGWIEMLGRAGSKQVSFDCSGFTTDDTLRLTALSATAADLKQTYTIQYLDATDGTTPVYEITGTFVIPTYSETGASDGGLEFSASFQSSGAVTGAAVP